MPYPVIIIRSLKVQAMALYPFILVQDAKYRNDQTLITHETIHLQQELEMLIIPFYLCYLVSYLYNRYRFGNHDKAYRNIIFELEAWQHENDPGYLKSRPFWAWLRFWVK